MLAFALFWFAAVTDRSRALTNAAEELLKVEKGIAASNDDAAPLLYDDVLALLDEATDLDPVNVHAHALTGEVLLLESDQGDGTYDICDLLDARDEATFVLKHAPGVSDTTIARNIMRAIRKIPASAIPGDPSDCEREERRHAPNARSS